MSFSWNWFQQLQLRSTEHTASNAKLQSRTNERNIAELEEKIDALSLACHAMWEILQENHGLTSAQLEQKIQEIDLRDGKADGKLDLDIKNCPECGHKINKRHTNCFYCGSDISNSALFHKS